ncbi:MAG: thioredoxin domain-containing protein [Patescibacteria group bacterium]
MTQHQRITWARRIMFCFALVGLFAASYLLYTYVTGVDLKCGPLSGCEVVRNSKWANWFGIPTPAFGVAFYLAVVVLSIYRAYAPHKNAKLTRILILLMAWAGFLESVFLTLIQRYVLNTFCFWCLVSAASATGLFIFVWLDKKVEFGIETAAKELKIVFAALFIGLVAGGAGFYFLLQPTAPRTSNLALTQGTPDKLYIPNGTTSTPQVNEPAAEGYPIVADTTPIEGPMISKVTLVEFYDFQCPACGIYHKLVIKPLRDKYQGRIKFAPRNFPLVEAHPYAMGAAIAGVCSQRQGKFFEYYDTLFANQKALTRPDLEKYAQSLGLDTEKFKLCLDDKSAQDQVLNDYNAGRSFGISSTPTLIINDALIEGSPNLDVMSKLIDERL